MRGGIPHATRRGHGAQPFAGKSGFPQRVQVALAALGDECLVVAFAQQRNALMAFLDQPAGGLIRTGIVVEIEPRVRLRELAAAERQEREPGGL